MMNVSPFSPYVCKPVERLEMSLWENSAGKTQYPLAYTTIGSPPDPEIHFQSYFVGNFA